MPMKAYVSIRGSRSPRRVDRDASPVPAAQHFPYASLSIQPDNERGHTAYELSCSEQPDGSVLVEVHRYRAPEGTTRVYAETIGRPS